MRLPGYAGLVRSWFAILVTLAACHDRELERLTAIRTTVCACKTVRCGEQAVAQVAEQPIQSTPRTQALAREMMDCLAKLQAADRPTTDPDAELPAAGSASSAATAAPHP